MNDELYEAARASAIELLGLGGVERLAPDQVMKIDLVTVLKLSLDDVQAKLIAGERADLGRVFAVTEALVKLLPAVPDSPAPPRQENDARARFKELLARILKAREVEEITELAKARAEIEELKREIAELRAAQSTASVADTKAQSQSAKPVPASERAVPPSQYLKPPPEPWRGHVGDGSTSGIFTSRASWDRGRGW